MNSIRTPRLAYGAAVTVLALALASCGGGTEKAEPTAEEAAAAAADFLPHMASMHLHSRSRRRSRPLASNARSHCRLSAGARRECDV